MRSLTGDVTAPRLFFFDRERRLYGILTGELTGSSPFYLTGRLTGNLTGSPTSQQAIDVAGREKRL